jgi:putative transposase
LRYKLSLRDLSEMFLVRGIEFSYETVREWEAKLTPLLIDDLRAVGAVAAGRVSMVDGATFTER